MESLTEEGVRLLAQQGTGYVLLCFVTAGWIWYAREVTKERRENERIRDELQEKRITETSRTVTTLVEVAAAMKSAGTALEEGKESRVALTQLVLQLAKDIERNYESWKPEVAAIRADLAKLIQLLEELLRRRG